MLANANDDEGLNQEVVKVSERSKAAEFMSLYMFLITDKLDGLVSGGKRKREGDHMSGLVDFLQLPDDYATRMSEPGKKRVDPGLCSALRLWRSRSSRWSVCLPPKVRWADLEEQKDADRKRAIGFVVGQTDWEKITDESGQLAQRALNRTKYFWEDPFSFWVLER